MRAVFKSGQAGGKNPFERYIVAHPMGDIIFSEGDIGTEMFIIQNGIVELFAPDCTFMMPILAEPIRGREALREIKADAELKSIPVIVLTASDSPQDVKASYNEPFAGETQSTAAGTATQVEAFADPAEAVARARAGGGPVLVTGSLYLLADLAKDESVRWRTLATG